MRGVRHGGGADGLGTIWALQRNVPLSLISHHGLRIMIAIFSTGAARMQRSAAFVAVLGTLTGAAGADDMAHHDHHHAHPSPSASVAVQRSEQVVTLPRVGQRSADGQDKPFSAYMDDGRPVVLNFIYTTCTAICPPMTRVFAEVQERLGAERGAVRLVSVSIDPEQDTPRRLKTFAAQFGAQPPWVFLTGTSASSSAIQEAFNVFRPDKMGHTPVTFIRRQPGDAWIRLDGIASAERILAEVRGMPGAWR